MNWKKIVLRGFLAILVLLLLLVTVVPYILYRKQKAITQHVISEVNEMFAGQLVVGDSHISIFEQFPYISIDLTDVRFFSSKDTLQRPLYEVKDFYVGFDIKKIFKGKYDVKRLKMEQGHIDLVQYADGNLNLLMAKKMQDQQVASDNDTSSFHFSLDRIEMVNVDITFLNEADSLMVEAFIKNAKASFSLKEQLISATLNTSLICNVINKGDTTFFKHKHVDIGTQINYNKEQQLVKIEHGTMALQDGQFGFSGSIDLDDDLLTDLEIHGNKPDFNLLLSLAPEETAEQFKPFNNAGRVYFDSRIRGKLAAGHKFRLDANFGCENGYFENTISSRRIDELGFKGHFDNGADSTWSSAILELNNISMRPGSGIFSGNIAVRNFLDPHITVNLHSDLDLQFLGDFFNVENLQGLKGKVTLDMKFNELIDFEAPENNLVRLKEGIDSELTIRDMDILVPGIKQPLRNLNLHAQMQQGKLEMDSLYFTIGESDFRMKGSLDDLPAIFHFQQKPVNVSLAAFSKKLKLSDIVPVDKSDSTAIDEEISDLSIKLSFKTSVHGLTEHNGLPRGEFFIDDFYAKFKNYPHSFHDFHADLLIDNNNIALKDFSGFIDQSDFHFSGKLSNYELWLDKDKKGHTTFSFDLRSDLLKLEDLFSYNGENYVPADYRHEEFRKVKLHGDLDLSYDSVLQSADLTFNNLEGKMKVHPLKLENFKGSLSYSDNQVHLRNFSGKMGESDLKASVNLYTGTDEARKKAINKIVLRSDFLDLDELLNYEAKARTEPHDSAFNIFELPFAHMAIEAHIGKLNYHQLWLTDFVTKIRMQPDHFLYVDTLRLAAAEGRMALKGYFNGSDSDHIYFKSNMQLDHVDIDKLLFRFDNFGNDYVLNENLHGYLSGNINSTVFMHPDLVPKIDKAEAEMDISITEGRIVNFAPMQALSAFFKDRNLRLIRFDTLRNTLSLKNSVLNIPSMNINSSLGFIEIEGTQSLDLNMQYFIRVPLRMVTQVGFRYLFGGKKKEEIDPAQEDAIVYRDMDKKVSLVSLQVAGTPEEYKVSLKKK